MFDPAVGPPKAVPTGYTQAFADAIVKEAEHDPRLVAITAAMPGPTGLLPFQARFPDRFFDVGIAEQHAVTGAAGMAMGGLRPVVALYSTFLSRAWDQVVYDVALHRLPGDLLPRPGRHHRRRRRRATTASTTWRCSPRCPGMRVLAPSSAQELQQMLHDAMSLVDEGPVAIRYPKGSARQVGEREVGSGLSGPSGPRAGDGSVCLLAVGKLVANAEKAAELAGRRRDRRHGVGRPLLCAARPRDDRRRGPPRGWSSRSRTASATAGIGMTHRRCGAPRLRREPPCPTSRCSACRPGSSPMASPTGSSPSSASTPTGIAATVRRLLAR